MPDQNTRPTGGAVQHALRSIVWRMLWLSGLLLPADQALAEACSHVVDVFLTSEINLTEDEIRWLDSLPPLQVGVIRSAPPLADFDEATDTYRGISLDVFCFIAGELGLHYELVDKGQRNFAAQLDAVEQGQLDMLMPLSRQREREVHGQFTEPYFRTYYATISRKGQLHTLEGSTDLEEYRIGVLGDTALAKDLKEALPESALRVFPAEAKQAFYAALREGDVDLLVQNKEIFIEDRYRYELFDLEVTQTLLQFPREYGFYFSHAQPHAQLVSLFNRYLRHIDVADSIMRHEVGEQRMIERYLQQRGRLHWQRLLMVSITLVMLLVLFYFWHYRRLSRKLDASHAQILEQQQALLEVNQALEKLSMTDSLTGLANRRQFDEKLLHEHALQRRSRRPLSLLMIDMDYFKQVNDRLGHAKGDDYLRTVAKALAGHCRRPGDLLARYGGEEMACLLPETPHREAVLLAERMREAVANLQLVNPDTECGYLTLSIGIATLTEQDYMPDELLAAADARLYQAKHAGRNRVCPDTTQLNLPVNTERG